MAKSHTSEYHSWRSMIDRCLNPKNKSYHNYGGRGILLTPEWLVFEKFLADIGPKPEPRYQLERIDNEKGYYPGNVRWATPSENRCNQRKPTKWKSWEYYAQLHIDISKSS